ncbi:hypothetical protein FOL46_008186 [Perkinsus olseni]|uniref:Peptidase A1 domain-containing protein n=1 Tax=Perkinsus olseni TaxID=32597 RepID=A0A7J6L8V4_PEROL|nr:hypothetical protein FOL46_008186 [Perkinsus olseni]
MSQQQSPDGGEPPTEAEIEWQDMFWRRVVWQTLVKRDGISSSLAIVDRVPFFDMAVEYSRVGEHPRPVLLIWGVNDQVNPLSVASTVRSFFSNVYLLRIQNAAHLTLCEQPIVTCSSILSFLNVPTDFRFRSGKQEAPPVQQEPMNPANGASTTRSSRSALRVKLPHAREVFIPVIRMNTGYNSIPRYGYALTGGLLVDNQQIWAQIDTGSSALFFTWKEWYESFTYPGASSLLPTGAYACPHCTVGPITDLEFEDGTTVHIFPHSGNLRSGSMSIDGITFGLVNFQDPPPDVLTPVHSIGLGMGATPGYHSLMDQLRGK